MEKLRSRLVDAGVTDFSFVPHVFEPSTAEVDNLAKARNADHCKVQTSSVEEAADITISGTAVKLKALVWHVLYSPSVALSINDSEDILDNNAALDSIISQNSPQDRFVVTACLADDRVDRGRLVHHLRTNKKILETSDSFRPQQDDTSKYCLISDVRLADKEIAEKLTGFRTRTIPPVAHDYPLSLFLDEKIFHLLDLNTQNLLEWHQDGTNSKEQLGQMLFSVGSGSSDYDLLLSPKDLWHLGTVGRSCPQLCSISVTSSNDRSVESTLAKTREENGTKAFTAIDDPRLRCKSLSKRLRDAAGKTGHADEIRILIEDVGDEFPLIMEVGSDGNFTKNALHLAAWKGDLESIALILDTGDSFGLDLINVISTGIGNYGKTPLFYAITQDRDDVVLFLLSRGANLLIVNNKGQTPCSAAGSHLLPETCARMYKIESEQIRKGGYFQNYRETHSDNRQYGDLDPRFKIDDFNMGDDIIHQIQHFSRLVSFNSNDGENKLLESKHGNHSDRTNLIIPDGAPRSFRETTKESRKLRADEHRLNASLASLGGKHSLPLPVQVSEEVRIEFNDILKQVVRKEKPVTENGTFVKVDRPKKAEKTVSVNELEKLSFLDVFPHVADGDEYLTVESMDELLILSRVIDFCVEQARDMLLSRHDDMDASIVKTAWGLDCEWKPIRTNGRDNPVATLQLSTQTKAFLVDVQTLCQSSIKDDCTEMTATETVLSDALTKIFSDPNISILGFGIGQDIGKLVASFPHLPCFRLIQSVIDLHDVAETLYNEAECKKSMSSLQKCVGIFLKKRLDKSEQCSRWDDRPLTKKQVHYALLDAAVLPTLLAKIFEKKSKLDEYGNSFFDKHSQLRLTVRFIYVDQNVTSLSHQKDSYCIEMGRLRRILDIWFARQTWPTGADEPPLPKLIFIKDNDVMLSNSYEESKEKKTINLSQADFSSRRSLKRQKKPLMLTRLLVDCDKKPTPGELVDYTKDSCIKLLLGSKFTDSMQTSSYLGYNRRGGVVEMRNAWLLFVNFGGGQEAFGRYQNKFHERGRQITFSINPSKPVESSLLYHLLASQKNMPQSLKSVFLFIRPSTKSKFLFCGECKCIDKTVHDEDVRLLFELIDYDELVFHTTGKTCDYVEMVLCHERPLIRGEHLSTVSNTKSFFGSIDNGDSNQA